MWLTKVKSFANDIQSALTAEEEEANEQEVRSDLAKLTELAELTTTQDKEVCSSKMLQLLCSSKMTRCFFFVSLRF
jgi:hypothetical protein